MKEQDKPVAVLSGDIIGSTTLSHGEYEDLLYTLRNELTFVCSLYKNNHFEINRGDSFQVLVYDAEHAAKYALLIKTGLRQINKGYDCRVSIGIGKDVSFRHYPGNSTGDSFTLSGRTLNEMTSETIKITTPNSTFNEQFELLTRYLDHQVSELTIRQCEIMHVLLRNNESLTQKKVAEILDVSRVSVHRSMHTANLKLITDYVDLFSKKVREFFF